MKNLVDIFLDEMEEGREIGASECAGVGLPTWLLNSDPLFVTCEKCGDRVYRDDALTMCNDRSICLSCFRKI